MPTTILAMEKKIGTTTYWLASMKASELLHKVTIPKEMPKWGNLSIEERYQRDINYTRVERQIAPYMTREDRFYGAIILTIINGDEVEFEPVEFLMKGLPRIYRSAFCSVGFLTLQGRELLVPLDGQHRVKAIQMAITGKGQGDKDLGEGFKQSETISNDDVPVMLVRQDPKKNRQIFTHVNRYAKATGKGQNIVTDDDDIYAVLAREVTNEFLSERLVKYTSSTLNAGDVYFTTLNTVYNCGAVIINGLLGYEFDKTILPDQDQQDLCRQELFRTWELILKGVEVFKNALEDPSEKGDQDRVEIRKQNLLGKPMPQECLVKAYMRLTTKTSPNKRSMHSEEALNYLNRMPWQLNEKNTQFWQGVLWSGGEQGGRIVTKHSTTVVAILTLMGRGTTEETRDKTVKDYLGFFPEAEKENRRRLLEDFCKSHKLEPRGL